MPRASARWRIGPNGVIKIATKYGACVVREVNHVSHAFLADTENGPC